MNEITKIHLGRQPFTIAVDAHHELQMYLKAIKKHMGNSDDAVEEVELRMAELLTERGIKGDKVVLSQDVDYLKQQLGEPDDFGDEQEEKIEDASAPKRLFRDTEHGILAGVASGIGNYLGIDALWVRLIFVILTLAGASGILIYIILWLIVPEAKTTSERLQMQGKPITVDALKDVVDRADVRGTASRGGRVIRQFLNSAARVLLSLMGIGFVICGLLTLLAAMTVGAYFGLHGLQLADTRLFPVGSQEVLVAVAAAVVVAVIAIATLLAGQAMLRRRWNVPGWAVASLVGVFMLSAAASASLGFSVAPAVGQRYQSLQHSEWLPQPVFAQVHVQLGDVTLSTKNDASYGVEIRTFGDVDISTIKVGVIGGNGGQLSIDATHFKGSAHRCVFPLCPYGPTNTEVVIHGPLPFGDVDSSGMMNFDPQIAPPDPSKLMPMLPETPSKQPEQSAKPVRG